MNHLPDFLIIGAARCGTSSLHASLARHPRIKPPDEKAFKRFASNYKEIHFFDKDHKFKYGVDFYRSFFIGPPQQFFYFESTPNYLYCPQVPARVKKIIPEAKFVVMLRNPVDRAWSHFCNWRIKSRLKESILYDPKSEILKKGIYHVQLSRWFEHFDRKQFFIIRSENFFGNERNVIKQTLEFLGLSPAVDTTAVYYDPVKKTKGNPPMSVKLRRDLKTFYRPHNNELETLLGRNFGWLRK